MLLVRNLFISWDGLLMKCIRKDDYLFFSKISSILAT